MKKPEPKKKQPVKDFARNTWTVENYENETLVFEGDDVSKQIVIKAFACTGTKFIVKGKIKAISIEGCKKCEIIADLVVSTIDVMNSKSIKVSPMVRCGFVNVECTNEFHLMLTNATRECKLATTCTRGVFVKFPKSGTSETDEEPQIVSIPVMETFETHVIGDTIETKPAESIE